MTSTTDSPTPTPLRYYAGQEVRLGDRVRWGAEGRGTVVVMIAEQTALPGYVAADWHYLGEGCLLWVDTAGLVLYGPEGPPDSDANLVLLERA